MHCNQRTRNAIFFSRFEPLDAGPFTIIPPHCLSNLKLGRFTSFSCKIEMPLGYQYTGTLNYEQVLHELTATT